MASNFPSSLDTFTNPSSTDAMDSVSVPHATQHSDLNDAVEALEAKVGADSSAVTSSHDYKIADHASRLTTLEGASTGSLVYITKAALSGSNVSFDNVFDSTYENYVIVVSDVSASAATGMYFRLRAASSDAAFARYYWHQAEGEYSSTAYQGRNGNGQTYYYPIPQMQSSSTDTAATTITVYQPALAKFTGLNHDGYEANTGRNYVKGAGFYQNTTVFDGFSLTPVSGTFASGNCFVYGLATS